MQSLRSLRFSLVLSASLSALTFGAAAAQAQDSAATQKSDVNEVIVTSQHRRESLEKVPVAVSSLGTAAIEQRQIQQTQDLGASVPSLTVQQLTAGPNTVQISLRGSVEQTGGLITSESPVAIYIDDVYQARLSTSNMELGDIERIEVLRGPQGTLYGRNSMTGAIQFITRQPDGRTWMDAQAAYGSYDEGKLQFSSGTPLTDHVALALSGLYDTKGGFQYDTVLHQNVGGTSHVAVRGSLGLFDTGPFTAVLHASYTDEFGQGVYFTPVNPITLAPQVPKYGQTNAPQKDYATSRMESVALNLGYDFGFVTLKSITAFQHLTDTWGLDFSGGFEPAPGAAPETGFFRESVASEHQITQEFRANGQLFGGRFKYIGGLFYFYEKADQGLNDTVGANVFFPGQAEFNILPTNYSTDSTSYAAYAQADYLITDRLTLTLGGRYSQDKKNFEGSIEDGLFVFPATIVSIVPTHISNSIVTPKATLSYQITNDILGYATVSRGYRAGGFNGLAVGDPTILGKPYSPERDWSYEVGGKIQLFDRRLTLNAAAYFEQLTNLQETAATSDGSFATQNAARAQVDGIELEWNYTPLKGLNFYGNLTLTDDKYNELGTGTEAYQAGATELPLLSRAKAQAGGSWRIAPAFLQSYPIIFAADYSYDSPHYSDAENTIVGLTNASNRVNASVTIMTPDEHWSVIASGRNVLNEKYYFSGISFITGLIASRFPAEPATWMVTLKYHY